MSRRRKIAGLALVAAAGLIVFWIQRSRAQSQADTGDLPTAVVTKGEFQKTVNGTGNLAPAEEVSLTFGASGTVKEVAVKLGERVVPGQLLARLDTRDLQLSHSAAAADLDVARGNLESARQALEELLAGPDALALQQAQIELEQAKNRLWAAQSQRDATCGRVKEKRAQQVDCDVSQASVNQAEAAVRAAQLKVEEVAAGPSASEVAAARAKVTQAEASLASAQVRLNQAELALAQATLTSPITGTVTAVGIKAGQLIASGQATAGASITVSDLDAFHITVYAAESDVTEIAVGQSAQVSLDAFTGETLQGEVTAVAPTGSVETGVVLYPVTVRVSPGKLAARAGMTASVDIVTVRRPEALMVPLRAVARSAQGSYVMRLASPRLAAGRFAAEAAATPLAAISPGGASGTGRTGPEPPAGAVVMRIDGTYAGGLPPGMAAGGRFAGSRRTGGAATAGGSAVTVSGWRARLSDAERVAVRLGPANDSVVVVESGLNEGDIVLVPEATASSSANAAFRFSVGGLFGGRQR